MPISYYYIDDINVEEVLNAKAGNDTYFIVGDSVQLGENPTENATYSWFPTTGLSNPSAPNPKAAPTSTTTYWVTKTQCSITTTDTVTLIQTGVGINELSEKTFKIYPNPANGSFSIEFKNRTDYKIEILNSLGETILTNKGISEQTIVNTSQLANGVYLIKTQNIQTNATFYDKIVISH